MIKTDLEGGALYEWKLEGLQASDIASAFLGTKCVLWKNKTGDLYIGLGRESVPTQNFPQFFHCTFEGDLKFLGYPLTVHFAPEGRLLIYEVSGTDQMEVLGKDIRDIVSNLKPKTKDIPPLLTKLTKLSPTKEKWEQWVHTAHQNFGPKLSKVVLCRKFHYSFTDGRGINQIYDLMAMKQPDNLFHCLFDDFISFSPESLFQVEGKEIKLEAIAGTRIKEKESELFTDKKEIKEHDEVVDGIKEAIKSLGEFSVGEKEILSLKSISHIRTPLSLKLNEDINGETLKSLIKILHPTAAVGGAPKTEAINLINKLEGNRDNYAGVFGVYDQDKAQATVLIRSLKIEANAITAFGGAGIIAASHFESEWIETENKIKSFLPEEYFKETDL